ncbi:cytochrome P450 [Arthrobacter crystallopoietes BAB-32]|uniref:Cytochrome P450 n=1 Tax=Arthrobacter crystallopoietes BAB-32 TaxID=1246476 RepID=N1UVA6_9MICC|nr:cytochrome P450 [Arthrobacter crystallopoietes]EMY34316.1 cytochrome P450 [Arthrobacter crystallopoietes BAB-32]
MEAACAGCRPGGWNDRSAAVPGVEACREDPYTDANLTDPYPLFERMRAAGPAVYLEKYGVLAFTRYAECKDILADHATFINGAGVGPRNLHREPSWKPQGILDSDPPVHTRMRKAMNTVISPRGVRALRAGFEAYAAELLPRLLARGRIDGIADLAQAFPLRAFGDAVGIPREGRAENLVRQGAMNFSYFGPEDSRAQHFIDRAAGTFEWVMDRTSRDSLAPGGMGAQLWELADEGAIDAQTAPLLVRALLSAGLDTTIIGIGNALKLLAEHPEEWAKLRANPRLAKFAIDEVLRFDSPFQSFFRTTATDTEFRGIRIPADTKIALFLGAANRDAAQFGPDADRFRIERDASSMIAFGNGIHRCVGQPITRLEMEVVLTWLAEHVERLELDGEPVPFLHNTLKGWESLPLRLVAA